MNGIQFVHFEILGPVVTKDQVPLFSQSHDNRVMIPNLFLFTNYAYL